MSTAELLAKLMNCIPKMLAEEVSIDKMLAYNISNIVNDEMANLHWLI